MSIASRIEAIEQHLTDDYNVLEVAGADLTNVDKNILNLKSTWQERLLYFINNGTDVVWNNWDKVTGEGTILTLNNTEEAPMVINLKGNTSQDSTTGKNLFSGDYSQFDSQGGTGITYGYFKLPDDNKQYTLTMIAKNDFTTSGNTYLGFTGTGGSSTGGVDWVITQALGTITKGTILSKTSNSVNRFVSLYNKGANYLKNLVDNFYIQLEEGTTATDYEPYTNGASPNPDYPQDIHVVSGDNSIVVCGKNLFNKIYFTTKYENWPAYAVHGGTFRLIPFYVGTGTKVTFSSNVPVASSSVIYAVNELDRIQGTTQNVNINTTRTIEGGSNGYVYLGFVIIRQYYDDLLNGTYWIQIEKGETATNYEASTTYPINLGTMELCKIGDYQDYIYKEGKKWYLHKEIEEFDLSSIAFWNKNQNGDFYTMNFSSIYGFKSGECLSNIFSYSSTSWVKNCFGITAAGVLWISTKDETLTSSDLFVSYLANKNAIMYGVLATPTYTEITDSTLLSQLEALEKGKSYTGQTNISQESNDLASILNATALREMT